MTTINLRILLVFFSQSPFELIWNITLWLRAECEGLMFRFYAKLIGKSIHLKIAFRKRTTFSRTMKICCENSFKIPGIFKLMPNPLLKRIKGKMKHRRTKWKMILTYRKEISSFRSNSLNGSLWLFILVRLFAQMYIFMNAIELYLESSSACSFGSQSLRFSQQFLKREHKIALFKILLYTAHI